MFVNNINPDIINIGPFVIRFYGIVYALGFLLVAYFLSKKSKHIKNLDEEMASDIAVYTMVAGLIGARIFHVISDFHLYRNNFWGMFAIWNGGLGFQGGLAAGLIAVYYYCKKNKINFLQVMDYISLPMPLILGFGRIANYINSEHLGYIVSEQIVPWCVRFVFAEGPNAACRHPAQLYQALSQFILFILILFIYKKWGAKKGITFGSFIIGYGLVRIITDFYRVYDTLYLGMSHTQILSILMILIGIYFVRKWWK